MSVSSIDNTIMFTGREYDYETGLNHLRARTLYSSLGRFMQHDPLYYVDGFNMFQYVNEKVINKTDNLGLQIYPDIPIGPYSPHQTLIKPTLSPKTTRTPVIPNHIGPNGYPSNSSSDKNDYNKSGYPACPSCMNQSDIHWSDLGNSFTDATRNISDELSLIFGLSKINPNLRYTFDYINIMSDINEKGIEGLFDGIAGIEADILCGGKPWCSYLLGKLFDWMIHHYRLHCEDVFSDNPGRRAWAGGIN